MPHVRPMPPFHQHTIIDGGLDLSSLVIGFCHAPGTHHLAIINSSGEGQTRDEHPLSPIKLQPQEDRCQSNDSLAHQGMSALFGTCKTKVETLNKIMKCLKAPKPRGLTCGCSSLGVAGMHCSPIGGCHDRQPKVNMMIYHHASDVNALSPA